VAPRVARPLDGVLLGRQLGEDVRGEVRREEDLGEHPLGLLHEPCGVLLRHAQRGGARARLRLDDGAQLLWREARDARADAVGGHGITPLSPGVPGKV